MAPRLDEQRDTGIAAGPVLLPAVSLGEPTSDAHLDGATPRRSSVSRHLAAPPERICTDVGENPPHRIAVLVVAAEYDLVPFLAGDETVHRTRRRAGPRGSPGVYARVVEPYDATPFARWGDGFVAEPARGTDPDVLNGATVKHPPEVPFTRHGGCPTVGRVRRPVQVPRTHELPEQL